MNSDGYRTTALLFVLFTVGLIAFGISLIYQALILSSLTKERDALFFKLHATEVEYASTSAALFANLTAINVILERTKGERDTLQGRLDEVGGIVDAMQAQVKAVSGTVGTLEKLQNTDKELLKKYSKVYFLNENFSPKELATIPRAYVFGDAEKSILNTVRPHLMELIDAAGESGVDLRVISAFRSFSEQSTLKTSYRMTYGTGANRFSADQGYSEHQLGTTVDFTTLQLGAKYTSIERDKAYTWLTENAHKYGFVLSYPKNNAYYVFEPWHWRYVGIPLATRLFTEGKEFYALDQREIDEYLLTLFD